MPRKNAHLLGIVVVAVVFVVIVMACRRRFVTEVRTFQRVCTSMVGDALCGAFPFENPLNLSRGNGRRSLLSPMLLLPWLREVNIGSGGCNAIVKEERNSIIVGDANFYRGATAAKHLAFPSPLTIQEQWLLLTQNTDDLDH
jgi:hypothetical protein